MSYEVYDSLTVDDSMVLRTIYSAEDLENNFRIHQGIVAIGLGIKQLKEEKPVQYKRKVWKLSILIMLIIKFLQNLVVKSHENFSQGLSAW